MSALSPAVKSPKIFHLSGGVLPPTPPLPDSEPPLLSETENFRDLFEGFNREFEGVSRESEELPPLELIEEGDIPRIEEARSGQDGDATSSRPPRQLRNRNVARSLKGSKTVRFCELVDCVELDQCFQEKIQFESEGALFPSFQHRDDIDAMSREKWELLYDPTPSRSLKRTRQQASRVAQQMLAKSHISTVCLLDQKTETTGYIVLSDAVTKKMDREERKYQKAMLICVQGIGASLNNNVEALDVVDGLGQSHHESLRSTKWEL